MLPLVLPPSVIGYYLLLAFGRGSPLFEWFNIRILFTWQAAVAASVVVGIPLMVQSSRAALANVDPVLENAARTLGASELRIFWRVTLPLRPARHPGGRDPGFGARARRVWRNVDDYREYSRSHPDAAGCNL